MCFCRCVAVFLCNGQQQVVEYHRLVFGTDHGRYLFISSCYTVPLSLAAQCIVIGPVGLWLFVCGSVTTITQNFVH